jgi:glycosyltransferase involved in cell wall biosynthesis
MNDRWIEQAEPKAPKVTVLMAVYNGERYLREAIDSILGQTFTDFEFLIVNDGSTDSSRDIIISYRDSRIRLIDNPENMGLTKSLNRGLAQVRSEYVARQDADDISYDSRLEKQIEFMDLHPEVVLLGTQARLIDERGRCRKFPIFYSDKATSAEGIRWQLMFDAGFIHTSVIFRKSIVFDVLAGYDNKYITGQDAELWSRLAFNYEIRNLAERLVGYRPHSASVTSGKLRGNAQSISGGETVFLRCLRKHISSDMIPDRWVKFYMQLIVGNPIERHDIVALSEGFKLIFKQFRHRNVDPLVDREFCRIFANRMRIVSLLILPFYLIESIKLGLLAVIISRRIRVLFCTKWIMQYIKRSYINRTMQWSY